MYRLQAQWFIRIILCVFTLITCKPASSSPPPSRLPSFLKVCHQSDPKLNECIRDSVEQLRPYLADVPSCEPLTIPEVIMNQGRGSVNVQSIYRNIKINGLSQFVLKVVRVDPDKDQIRIKLWLPYIRMVSDYTIEGKIMLLPIFGSGVSRGNYTDIDMATVIHGEKLSKDGQTYFNVKNVYVDFNVGHANIYFSNLFNGDKELGEAMNVFLNDNWKNVSHDMKPIFEETIGNLVKKFWNKIYHKYPLEELLPL